MADRILRSVRPLRRYLTSSSPTNASRDNRLAGRRRFYRHVGVELAKAPWVVSSAATGAVASPISAGVDGTDSASGVVRKGSHKDRSSLLQPRRPGSTVSSSASSWYTVTLDGRPLKTPLGDPLVVPSDSLATMIAAEWNAQSPSLVPAQMPLTTLACTALDQTSRAAETYRQQSLRFLATDTLTYWADPTQDRGLHRRQSKAWEPVLAKMQDRLGFRPALLQAQDGRLVTRSTGARLGSWNAWHPIELQEACRDWTYALDAWHLTALHSVASESKSFCMAWALLEDDSPYASLTDAVEAARVEEEFQISNWGLVEGGHDYDRLNCSVQLHAAVVMKDCLALVTAD